MAGPRRSVRFKTDRDRKRHTGATSQRKSPKACLCFAIAGFELRHWRLRCRLSKRGQRKLKRAAYAGIASGPYAAAMLPDNRSTDRQADTHAVRLCCEEGGEQLIDILRLDAGAGILDRNEYLIGPVLARPYQ